MNFAGCYTAIVTPFRQGQVDFPALQALIELQIAGGVAGIVAVGTTGESPTLDFAEHEAVVERTIEFVKGRCPVIAGTGANSTDEALKLTRHALRAGAAATLQVSPYYNKPTPKGMYAHFAAVADVGLPVMLYNVPGRTGSEIPLEVVRDLARNGKAAAIKEAAGSVDRVSRILEESDLTVLSGDDALALPMMAVGATGVVSVASNVMPGEVARMITLALAGDYAGAQKLHRRLFPLFRALFVESNPGPVKAALATLGLIAEEYRLPLAPLEDKNRVTLLAAMRQVGLLG